MNDGGDGVSVAVGLELPGRKEPHLLKVGRDSGTGELSLVPLTTALKSSILIVIQVEIWNIIDTSMTRVIVVRHIRILWHST